MNNKTYILYHNDSPICQDSIKSLPPDYDKNVTLHDVAKDTHESMNHHISNVVSQQRSFRAQNPEKRVTPTVMYYDHKTQAYIKKDGVDALKFIHNYSTQKKSLALKQMHNTHTESMSQMNQTGSNLQRVIDMHKERTTLKIQQQPQPHLASEATTFRKIVESNHKIQLQSLYNKIHNEIHKTAPDHGQ